MPDVLAGKDRRSRFMAIALVMCLYQVACGAGNRANANARPNQPNEVTNKQTGEMKIRIKIEDKVVTATLNDSEAARDLVSLLRLTLTLEDYNRTEKISDLPKRLSTEGAPRGSHPDVGNIAYYAPWGNLAIFYRDFGYSNGLVILGKLDVGAEVFNTPGSVKATIELVK